MTASTMSVIALICMVGAVFCGWLAVRNCDVDLLAPEYEVSTPPHALWLFAAFAWLIGCVIFGVGAIVRAGLV